MLSHKFAYKIAALISGTTISEIEGSMITPVCIIEKLRSLTGTKLEATTLVILGWHIYLKLHVSWRYCLYQQKCQ